MADSPYLADFLAKQKGSGAGTKSGLLPPIIAPGLFGAITGTSEAGSYNSLSRIGQQIQQSRADADQAHILKLQRDREKKLMKMIKDLQRQASTPSVGSPGNIPAIAPPFSGGGSGLNRNSGVTLPSIGGDGGVASILPPIVDNSGSGRPRGYKPIGRPVRNPQLF